MTEPEHFVYYYNPCQPNLKYRLCASGMRKNYYKVKRIDESIPWPSEQEIIEFLGGRRGFVRKWVEDGVLMDVWLT